MFIENVTSLNDCHKPVHWKWHTTTHHYEISLTDDIKIKKDVDHKPCQHGSISLCIPRALCNIGGDISAMSFARSRSRYRVAKNDAAASVACHMCDRVMMMTTPTTTRGGGEREEEEGQPTLSPSVKDTHIPIRYQRHIL